MKKAWITTVMCISLAVSTVFLASCTAGQEPDTGKNPQHEVVDKGRDDKPTPSVQEMDYSTYFNGLEGCAVVFDSAENQYLIYNKELAEKRVSPCSTFKIVSSVLGLESGILQSVDTKLGYDGTRYGRQAWNGDLTLKEAFANSCVWYFRKVIDQVGPEETQAFLQKLSYGNGDISQWEGGTINPLPELNGFWIESSLTISPKEQVDVMQQLFGDTTPLSDENMVMMKDIMAVGQIGDGTMYGKTGSGRNNSWFVGFCETGDNRQFFAVHLSDKTQKTAGADAKEIALQIMEHNVQ